MKRPSAHTPSAIRYAKGASESGAYMLGISENPDGSGWSLIFQLADEFDEQDEALGMATYCIATPDGRTHYGGVESCELLEDELHLALSPRAARTLGLQEHLRLPVILDDRSRATLLDGLTQVGLLAAPA
jgi:hypothetical protein